MTIFAHMALSLLVPTWIGTRNGQNTLVIFFFLASNFLLALPLRPASVQGGHRPREEAAAAMRPSPVVVAPPPSVTSSPCPDSRFLASRRCTAPARRRWSGWSWRPEARRCRGQARPASTPHSYRADRRHLPWPEAGHHGRGIREPRKENGAGSGSSRGCEEHCRWGR
jgi:hypothetical protein